MGGKNGKERGERLDGTMGAKSSAKDKSNDRMVTEMEVTISREKDERREKRIYA